MKELKQKIFVVDDEPCIRKFLRTLLEVDGYHVDTVSSGKEAIARINKGERPDFIILDVLMAEMNGLETLQELMRLDRSLNVIMAAWSNEPGTIGEALRLGARNYLVHPFEKAELDKAILQGEALQ
jgi:CheY-like chemotaxis protein